ncbi:hypothetical protein SXIM_07150 [Streptomyces xiamenensis]|uniref:Uncharacterized protein n=1 Tax=Streptomyces xiamenensis TaxID=408015 RepID=A0A0F7FQ83_9ACTN|nr:hypothetical protein SXIM_07150 [Streptomyces xiamenensis]
MLRQGPTAPVFVHILDSCRCHRRARHTPHRRAVRTPERLAGPSAPPGPPRTRTARPMIAA